MYFLHRFLWKSEVSNLTEIRPIAATWTDERTDRHTDEHKVGKRRFWRLREDAWKRFKTKGIISSRLQKKVIF